MHSVGPIVDKNNRANIKLKKGQLPRSRNFDQVAPSYGIGRSVKQVEINQKNFEVGVFIHWKGNNYIIVM